MSSKNHEESGYGPSIDLLAILHLVCIAYLKRSGLDRNIHHLRLVYQFIRVDFTCGCVDMCRLGIHS